MRLLREDVRRGVISEESLVGNKDLEKRASEQESSRAIALFGLICLCRLFVPAAIKVSCYERRKQELKVAGERKRKMR